MTTKFPAESLSEKMATATQKRLFFGGNLFLQTALYSMSRPGSLPGSLPIVAIQKFIHSLLEDIRFHRTISKKTGSIVCQGPHHHNLSVSGRVGE